MLVDWFKSYQKLILIKASVVVVMIVVCQKLICSFYFSNKIIEIKQSSTTKNLKNWNILNS